MACGYKKTFTLQKQVKHIPPMLLILIGVVVIV